MPQVSEDEQLLAVRFGERDVETEYGPDNEAPTNEKAGNR